MKKIFLLSLVSLFAFAEEKTVPPPRWENNAELAALVTSGNSEVTTIGIGAASIFRPNPWLVRGKANYLNNVSSGTQTAEQYNLELRGERKVSDRASGFLSATYLKNRFSGFDDRLGAEAGVGYAYFETATQFLNTEVGLGFLKENRTDNSGDTFATGRLGVNYRWKFSANAELSNSLTYLDNLKQMQDWRISDTLSVTSIMSELLSLKVSFKVDFLNVPVTGKKSTDTATTIALVAKF